MSVAHNFFLQLRDKSAGWYSFQLTKEFLGQSEAKGKEGASSGSTNSISEVVSCRKRSRQEVSSEVKWMALLRI